jgi:hypothetical protein
VATEGATRARETDEQLKPVLVRLFEAIAVVMDLDAGNTRLELEFEGGHLRRGTSHDERNGHEALRRFDARAPALVELVIESRSSA